MRILIVILFFFVNAAAIAQQKNADRTSQAVKDEEIIRSDSNLVSVPVSFADRDGKFVGNLTAADFLLFDNERKIEYFESSEQPFSVLRSEPLGAKSAEQAGGKPLFY